MKTARKTIEIIRQTVARTLPAGNTFELLEESIDLSNKHILRVITPSWRRMDKMDRFARMQDAILPELTPEEKKKIFRISVLTPAEWDKIKQDRPGAKVISRGLVTGGSSKTATPRPAAASRTAGRKKTASTIVAGKKG